jgi:hypothetical protein
MHGLDRLQPVRHRVDLVAEVGEHELGDLLVDQVVLGEQDAQ